MEKKLSEKEELFFSNNIQYLNKIKHSLDGKLLFLLNKRFRNKLSCFASETDTHKRIVLLEEILDDYNSSFIFLCRKKIVSVLKDIFLYCKYGRKRYLNDYSPSLINDYVSLVCIVKNEARDIVEFIEFYKKIGVDRIFLYDNGSTDNLREVIEEYIKSGYVIYIYWPGKTVQTSAYRDAVKRSKKTTKWLAIVDADEFLFSPQKLLSETLKDYEQFPGVCVNWVMFGPNGHDSRPDGNVIENYTKTIKDYNHPYNCRIKSIVKPSEVLTIDSTHFAYYKKGRNAINENYEEVNNHAAYKPYLSRAFTENNSRTKLRINHYSTKSLEDLRNKCSRGYADGTANAVFEAQLSIYLGEQVEDTEILDLVAGINK